MALKKTIGTEDGNTAEYHRIMAIFWWKHSDETRIELGMYKDEKSARAGKLAMDVKEYSFTGIGQSRPEVYAAIKQHEDMIGATDV